MNNQNILKIIIITAIISFIYSIISALSTILYHPLNQNFFAYLYYVKGNSICYKGTCSTTSVPATGAIFKYNDQIGEYIRNLAGYITYYYVYLNPNGSINYILVEDPTYNVYGIYTEQNISQYIYTYSLGYVVNGYTTENTIINGLPSICYIGSREEFAPSTVFSVKKCFLTVNGEITPIITYMDVETNGISDLPGNAGANIYEYKKLTITSIKYNLNEDQIKSLIPLQIIVYVLNDNDTSPENLSIILNPGTDNEYICNYTLDPVLSISESYNCILPNGTLYSVEINISSPPGNMWQIQLIYSNGTMYNCIIDGNMLCPPGYNMSIAVQNNNQNIWWPINNYTTAQVINTTIYPDSLQNMSEVSDFEPVPSNYTFVQSNNLPVMYVREHQSIQEGMPQIYFEIVNNSILRIDSYTAGPESMGDGYLLIPLPKSELNGNILNIYWNGFFTYSDRTIGNLYICEGNITGSSNISIGESIWNQYNCIQLCNYYTPHSNAQYDNLLQGYWYGWEDCNAYLNLSNFINPVSTIVVGLTDAWTGQQVMLDIYGITISTPSGQSILNIGFQNCNLEMQQIGTTEDWGEVICS